MAKYNFKQAALLGGGLGLKATVGADGKPLKQTGGGHRHLYPKGIHEVKDEKHLADPTFKHLLKHKLIEKVSEKDGPKELKPASSGIALASQKAAKSQTDGEVSPDAEIGGDDEAEFEDVEDDGEEVLSEEDAESELGEDSGEEVVEDGEPNFGDEEGEADHQAPVKKKKKKKKRG